MNYGSFGLDLKGPLSTVSIPDTLQDSLMARLDQLRAAKEVAQLGAVLGREFAYDVLLAIAPMDEAALQDGLRRRACSPASSISPISSATS
jgi:predicted ATPase